MSNGILNIPLQEGIDAGGLGIFDTFTGTGGPIIFPDQSPDLPPPGEILDEGLAELARRAGIDITAQEAGDLRETVLEGGNIGQAATDIAANIAERKRDSIINSGLASVVPELLSPFAGVNQAVNVIATADNLANLAADFAQDVPIAGPLTAEAADFTGDLSQLTFDVTSPAYRGLDVLQRRIIDPITGRIRSVIDPRRLLNLINPFDYHVGHDKPESKGGTSDISNIKPICARCNLSMSDNYTIQEWIKLSDKDKKKNKKCFLCC